LGKNNINMAARCACVQRGRIRSSIRPLCRAPFFPRGTNRRTPTLISASVAQQAPASLRRQQPSRTLPILSEMSAFIPVCPVAAHSTKNADCKRQNMACECLGCPRNTRNHAKTVNVGHSTKSVDCKRQFVLSDLFARSLRSFAALQQTSDAHRYTERRHRPAHPPSQPHDFYPRSSACICGSFL